VSIRRKDETVPQEFKLRISFDIEGELARAFVEELGKTLVANAEQGKPLVTKAELCRAALVEFLNRRGHKVEDTTGQWGGYRERSEDTEEGQFLVAGVG
jgi:hypothetical protein